MVPLLVASRSPWNCLSRSMRPMAAPPPFSSGGCGSILTSKGPVAWRDMTAFFVEVEDFGLVWAQVWACVEIVARRSGVRQAAARREHRAAEARVEADATFIFRVGSGGGPPFGGWGTTRNGD